MSRKTKEKKIGITTKNSNIIIFVDKFGRITKYMNDNLKYFGDYFLLHNKVLNELVTPNIEYTGNFCFKENTELKELSLPDVKRFGDYFMCSNEKLSRFDVPLDISFGSHFMKNNLYVNELLKVNNSKEYIVIFLKIYYNVTCKAMRKK